MKLRDHEPIVIDKFNGLWQRGDVDNTPLDHFSDCENVKFVGDSSFRTRDGIGISQDVSVPLSNVKRIYNYPTQTANTLIVLIVDGDDGKIYHVVNATTVFGPILTVAGMTDFAFLPVNGRAYLSPFTSFQDTNGLNIEKGLEDEFLYVYMGDGTPARKAGGTPITGLMTLSNGAAGNTDPGFHLFGVVGETDSGAFIAPGEITGFTTAEFFSVNFVNIPTGDATIVRRHIVATKVVTTYDNNPFGFDFFFIPNATINDNVTTTLSNISFFDSELIEDASYLLDNYVNIPAGAVLAGYNSRLVLCTTFDDISIGLVSTIGEPESISQIDGIIIVPPDGNPITNACELRDVLYVMKRSRTVSFTDNGDAPSSWPLVPIDTALGTCIHGIATVLDSGGSSVDYLIVATYQGIVLFNGRYINPELSWKIEQYWRDLNRNEFRKIQIINAPIQKEVYIVLPTRALLVANYVNGFDPKKIRWAPWTFLMGINTVAIYNINEIILGAD